MSQAASSPVAGTPRARPSIHEIGVRFVLALTGIVVATALVELVLRVTAYHQTFAEADATIGHVLTPRFSRVVPVPGHAGGSAVLSTNNLGLRRDVDTTTRKPAKTTRVLVLGDSQAEGIVNNDETFSAGLESALNQAQRNPLNRARHNVEVLNAAVSGYSPLLEYLWLRQRGRALQPDVILLAVYAGNDIADMSMHNEEFGGFGPRFMLPFLERTRGKWQIRPPGYENGILGRIDWLLQTYLWSYAMVRRVSQPQPRVTIQGAALKRVTDQCFGCLQSLWQAFVARGDVSGLDDGFAKLDYLLGQFESEAQGSVRACLS